jgi:hypothetical protein
MVLALLLWSLTAFQDSMDIETLLKYLHANGSPEQYDAMTRFARQTNAPAAIPRLIDVLKAEAPQMDNNICLALEFILREHPDSECPIDPLLEAISRPIWNSQQKAGQALYHALKEAEIERRREELCRRLIPLLTSQRPRVFDAALRSLQKITGEKMGPDADMWNTYYEKTFPGKKLDLSKAVYEDIVIVRPLEDKSPVIYTVNGEKVGAVDALKRRLVGLKESADRNRHVFSVVIQVSNERMDKMFQTGDFSDIVEANMCVASVTNVPYTVSPESDVFRAPYGKK